MEILHNNDGIVQQSESPENAKYEYSHKCWPAVFVKDTFWIAQVLACSIC